MLLLPLVIVNCFVLTERLNKPTLTIPLQQQLTIGKVSYIIYASSPLVKAAKCFYSCSLWIKVTNYSRQLTPEKVSYCICSSCLSMKLTQCFS